MGSQASLWQSIMNSRKAITAGILVLATFVSATLQANGGKPLSATEWIYAGSAYIVTHFVVHQISNDNMISTTALTATVAANPVAAAALVAPVVIAPVATVSAPADVPDVPVDLPTGPVDAPPDELSPAA